MQSPHEQVFNSLKELLVIFPDQNHGVYDIGKLGVIERSQFLRSQVLQELLRYVLAIQKSCSLEQFDKFFTRRSLRKELSGDL